MKIETMAQVERDRVAIAAAVAVVFGRAVRVDGVAAHPNGRAETWVREGRLAVQSRRMAAPLGWEWSR